MLANGQTQNPLCGVLGIMFKDPTCKKELVSLPDMIQHKT